MHDAMINKTTNREQKAQRGMQIPETVQKRPSGLKGDKSQGMCSRKGDARVKAKCSMGYLEPRGIEKENPAMVIGRFHGHLVPGRDRT